ncbi:MAG TPA: Mrp/NBP35 family ATP-binding protein [Tissierellaceae bacterium]|nr:Mrp/NBP35 family ATP-binding protein [Tissierellaceae bacterium]
MSKTNSKNKVSPIPKEKLNQYSNVKKVIGVVSGKGGVGKSLITSMLATTMNRRNHNTAILDADLTGPSIPKIFGIEEYATGTPHGILPAESKTGINIMSMNLLLDNVTDPVLWKGPIISGTLKQFWTEVIWNSVDYMFIDMPPGTGDVPLTVFQSLPVDGIVIVTSPQDLVSMIVTKAVIMAKKMNIPIIGLVENMSYFQCPNCDEKHHIFGKSNIEAIAKEQDLEILSQIPIDPKIAKSCDTGDLESMDFNYLDKTAKILENL